MNSASTAPDLNGPQKLSTGMEINAMGGADLHVLVASLIDAAPAQAQETA